MGCSNTMDHAIGEGSWPCACEEAPPPCLPPVEGAVSLKFMGTHSPCLGLGGCDCLRSSR